MERLILIGTSSTFLGIDALRAAVNEAKQGQDVKKYLEAVGHLQIVGPTEKEAVVDSAWVEKQNKHNGSETNRLEHELKGYKNNLIKESIRVSDTLSSNLWESDVS